MQQITKRFISIVVAGVISAMGLTSATAQKAANEPLQVKLVRSKIVLEGGREAIQSAAIANPGDILEEVATYTNISKAPLKSVEATLPIPARWAASPGAGSSAGAHRSDRHRATLGQY